MDFSVLGGENCDFRQADILDLGLDGSNGCRGFGSNVLIALKLVFLLLLILLVFVLSVRRRI